MVGACGWVLGLGWVHVREVGAWVYGGGGGFMGAGWVYGCWGWGGYNCLLSGFQLALSSTQRRVGLGPQHIPWVLSVRLQPLLPVELQDD